MDGESGLSREEDVQHDIYRPVYRDVISATLSDGKVAAWKYRVAGSSVMARWFPPGFDKGVDIDGVDSAIDMPYDVPELSCGVCPRRTARGADRILAWRWSEQQCVRH